VNQATPTGLRGLIPWKLLRGWDPSGHGSLDNARRGAAEIGAELSDRRSLALAAQSGERRLTVLSRSDCCRLLASRKVGRLAFMARAGVPLIVPVNYVFDGRSILIRSGPGPKLLAAEREELVSFEVDDLDEELRAGWSVVVTGRAKRLLWAHHGSRERSPSGIELPEAWAAGPREHVMSIEASRISGRRLGPAGAR
jgi:uncharacterized protein